jgi:endonuclease/exonuclease/phosphatase family metal-dependent hydrolase
MNTFKLQLSVILLFALPAFPIYGQKSLRVMFYNVENLFDTEDDPHHNDNEFLPNGQRHWTQGRYSNKLNNIARVISAAGEWDVPSIVGLCEVENERVVNDLCRRSPLKKWGYRFVMTDSPDDRGIDVALMYQTDRFRLLTHRSIRLAFPYNPRKRTRDILHVTGLAATGDTLDIFVCHFPSRRGGEKQSEPDRMYAAKIIKSQTDSLMCIRQNALIFIMGDFNDEPSNSSICNVLEAAAPTDNPQNNRLYNLFYRFEKERNKGSYKFGRTWNMLDQMIVSGNLIAGRQKLKVLPYTAQIFSRPWMLTDDKSRGGKRPKKTFHGQTHEGGFSDHLPVTVDLQY